MKWLEWCKDGGPDSNVSGLFVVEIKSLFSIVLLKFANGSREAFHEHAFNALSWVLRGKLVEDNTNWVVNTYTPSLLPIFTKRSTFHRVVSIGDTWVISLRGPWRKQWREYIPATRELLTLTNGRTVVQKETLI
jgi:predicted metal-dependent enzyme (double-stranded beta helix superfamily)